MKDTSGPAFPTTYGHLKGMTHRQWLAALAMQWLLSCATNPLCAWRDGFIEAEAHKIADAMLKYESEEG